MSIRLFCAAHLEGFKKQALAYLHGLGQKADWIGFASSGSSAAGTKFVLFEPEALCCSAMAVNEHLKAYSGAWLNVLPRYHVGGYMVGLRAALAGLEAIQATRSWDAANCVALLEKHRCSYLSLVPTQVYDLLQLGCPAPSSLRAVIVGGGGLEQSVGEQARRLGWPLMQSYGMTEAASQIATALPGEANFDNSNLPLLDIWQAREDSAGRLQIKGEALAAAILRFDEHNNAFVLEQIPRGSWFTSNDRVSIKERKISFLGRSDRQVKVLGELLDLDLLERELAALCDGVVVVIARGHERNGAQLHAFGCSERLPQVLQDWNARCPGFMRISSWKQLERMPLSALGKIDRTALGRMLE